MYSLATIDAAVIEAKKSEQSQCRSNCKVKSILIISFIYDNHYLLHTFRKNFTVVINVLPCAVNVLTVSIILFARNAVGIPSSVDTSKTFMEIN